MAFKSLPAELTITVAGLLDPFSSFGFALTCKAYWKLCNTIITKHKRLFAENYTIDARDSEYPYQNHILWDKLKEILDDPTVGQYVRDISLPSSRATYLDGTAMYDAQLTAQSPQLSQEDFDHYASSGRQIEELYRSVDVDLVPTSSTWDEWVLKGSSEPIIVMLVHHLHNLKTFRFTDLEMELVFMRCTLATAIAYGNPVLAPRLPFQHLTTVAIAHSSDRGGFPPEWCLIFCAIPSLRNFVANAMSGEIDPISCQLGQLPASNVRELVFENSRLESKTIEAIVKNTPSLEKFSYEVGAEATLGWTTPMLKQDLESLVQHVGHSLQHLVIYTDYDYDECEGEDLPKVSLRGFQQLKTLVIEWSILLPNEDTPFDDKEKSNDGFYQEDASVDNDFDLRSLLPASLEKLYLWGPFTEEEREKISKIQDGPSEFTPLLREIYIGDTSGSRRLENGDVPRWDLNPLLRYLEGQGWDY